MWAGHQECLTYMHVALGTENGKREIPIAWAQTFNYTASHTILWIQLNRLGFLSTGFHHFFFFSNSLFLSLAGQHELSRRYRNDGGAATTRNAMVGETPTHPPTTAQQNFLVARTTLHCGNLYPPHDKKISHIVFLGCKGSTL